MESAMDSTGTRYLNLGKIEASKISENIASYKPDILICAIETLARQEVQQALLSTKLAYIALDVAQVREGLKKKTYFYPHFVDKGGGWSADVDKREAGGMSADVDNFFCL